MLLDKIWNMKYFHFVKEIIICIFTLVIFTQNLASDEIVDNTSYIVYGKLLFTPKIPLVEINTSLLKQADTYDLKFTLKTINVANIVKKINGHGAVQGKLKIDSISPSKYFYDLTRDEKSRIINLEFNEGKLISEITNPIIDKSGLSPVSEEMLINILDPASMFLIISNYYLSNKCKGSINVYDGKRRYDLNYISKDIHNNKIICKMNQIKLGGYKDKDMDPLATPDELTVTFMNTNGKYYLNSIIGNNDFAELSIEPK